MFKQGGRSCAGIIANNILKPCQIPHLQSHLNLGNKFRLLSVVFEGTQHSHSRPLLEIKKGRFVFMREGLFQSTVSITLLIFL